MKIGPRTEEMDNRLNHVWYREINGVDFRFNHVKASRLGQPYMTVWRWDTLVRCSCPRPDCPFP